MLKIMIVDDEVIIRTGLATVINWDELELILLEPAASAEEALSRIPHECPDILLTDIRMAGKSGLELAEEARDLMPELDIIILTGFDDFKYTQRAIQTRVNDYLLKTSRPDDIIRTILRAKQRIEERNQIQNHDFKKLKRSSLERFIIFNEPINQQLENELYLSFTHLHENLIVEGYHIWILIGAGWTESTKTEKLLSFAIENICKELLPCETFIHQNKVIAILPIFDSSNEFEFRKNYIAVQKIEAMLRCKIGVTVGKKVSHLEDLHHSYLSAETIYPYLGLMPYSIICYEDIILRTGAPTPCTVEEQAQLISILLEDDPIALKLWITSFIQNHLSHPQFTLDSLEASMQFIVTVVNQWLDRALQAIGADEYYPQSLPFRYNREAEPVSCLFQHVHALMKVYHQLSQKLSISHVQKAKSYIESHVGLDLTLQQVAKRIHIHPNHLSELFKKETGINFSDYLTKQRMKRAIQLLSTTKMKVSDVATQVGYTDVKYFSQLFKRDTGVTPSEYRELSSQ